MIAIVVIGLPLVWGVFAWLLSLIPFVGIITAVSIFALVLAIEIAMLIVWVIGMVYAWQAQIKPVPLVGVWAERIFGV